MMKKTNVARILDKLKISYELIEYPVDEKHLDAVYVAEVIGMPVEMVYKTLCVRGDRIPIQFAVLQGDGELDLKALARLSGNKRCELVALKDLLPLTGYIRGGCSPLGAKKDYPVFIDEHCLKLEKIIISAGLRGMQIILSPQDLIKATNAVVGEFSIHIMLT